MSGTGCLLHCFSQLEMQVHSSRMILPRSQDHTRAHDWEIRLPKINPRREMEVGGEGRRTKWERTAGRENRATVGNHGVDSLLMSHAVKFCLPCYRMCVCVVLYMRGSQHGCFSHRASSALTPSSRYRASRWSGSRGSLRVTPCLLPDNQSLDLWHSRVKSEQLWSRSHNCYHYMSPWQYRTHPRRWSVFVCEWALALSLTEHEAGGEAVMEKIESGKRSDGVSGLGILKIGVFLLAACVLCLATRLEASVPVQKLID